MEELAQAQIERSAHEKLKVIAEKQGMKLYKLLSIIVNEWIEKQK